MKTMVSRSRSSRIQCIDLYAPYRATLSSSFSNTGHSYSPTYAQMICCCVCGWVLCIYCKNFIQIPTRFSVSSLRPAAIICFLLCPGLRLSLSLLFFFFYGAVYTLLNSHGPFERAAGENSAPKPFVAAATRAAELYMGNQIS